MSLSLRSLNAMRIVIWTLTLVTLLFSEHLEAQDSSLRRLPRPANPATYVSNGEVDEVAELSARIRALEEALSYQTVALPCEECLPLDASSSGRQEPTIDIFGRLHLDNWNYPDTSPGINAFESGDPNVSPQDSLGFRRVRIGVKGDIRDNMLYKLELEFAAANDSEFRDIYIGWKDLPYLNRLQVGNFKRPYGLDHLNSSRFNVFLERPFVIEGFNQDARRFGIASLGVSDDKRWNWRYGFYNQRLIQDEGSYISDHWQAQFAARLANTYWYDKQTDGRSYGHWAIAGTFADTDPNADNDTFANSGVNEADFRTRPEARTVSRWLDTDDIDGGNNYGLLALESVLNFGSLQMVGEYQSVWLNRDDASDLNFYGGYVYLSYFLTGEHIPWDRTNGVIGRVIPRSNFLRSSNNKLGCGIGAWQIAARYSVADFADDDVLGGRGESFTLGLNWHWNPNARLQLNYIYGEISDNDLNAAGGSPNFGNYQIIGTRVSVNY